jgi:MoaA/NifB/PqqE/SkfB family radical SAM enzyme
MFDLAAYMNSGISGLLLDALKISASRPRELVFLRSFFKSLGLSEKRRRDNDEAGLHVPPFLIASITSNCNLFCSGCYARANQSCAGAENTGKALDAGKWSQLFREAADLGVCFILLAGGEPLLRPDVLEAAAACPEIIFPIFTNGTLLDDKALELFDRHRNLLPVVSIEGERGETDARRGAGVFDSIMAAMAGFKKRKILFGASITATRGNIDAVTGESFVKGLRKRGCGLAFYVEYVPSDNISLDQAPTAIERALLAERIKGLKKAVNMLFISFPGDEQFTGGCLAAGRGFMHINADGRVEPCPFSPYSDTNLSNLSLAEALRSPFLASMREDGFLLGEHDGGCLLFEKRAEVEKMLQENRNETA